MDNSSPGDYAGPAPAAGGPLPPAGWYPEGPQGRLRWWDGQVWGPHVPLGPSKRSRRVPLAIAAGVIVAAVAALLLIGTVGTTAQQDTASSDITVTFCARNTDGVVRVRGTVLNSGSKTASYYFKVAYQESGVRLGTTSEVVSDVEPGQEAMWDSVLYSSYGGGPSDTLRCNIIDLSRR